MKINGIETGQRGIRTRELRELLDTYGADPALADALAALARPRRRGRLVEPLRQRVARPYLDFVSAETTALAIAA